MFIKCIFFYHYPQVPGEDNATGLGCWGSQLDLWTAHLRSEIKREMITPRSCGSQTGAHI